MSVPRTILHVDMDAFFAAVEVRGRPELRGRPVIVGGSGRRGVVAAASYEARRFGVRSAMPSVQARRLCPDAVWLAGDHTVYEEESLVLHGILASFTPLVEGIALDEAFLDVTGARRLFGDGVAIAGAIRRRVADEMHLTCSVGVASTKLLAKLASEAAKPVASPAAIVAGPGVVVVEPGTELAFLHPLPVRALWGVGPATQARLHRLGVETVGDLAELPEATLVAAVGVAQGRHLHRLARGEDDRPVVAQRAAKSIGHEQTFADDLDDRADCERVLLRQCDAVASRLRAHRLGARTVTLKVRFGDFRTITRSVTTAEPVDTVTSLAAAARRLLDGVAVGDGVRLLGVSAGHLVEGAAHQLSFDEAVRPAGWGEASRTVDEIRRRFGADAIGPASLAGGPSAPRPGERPWGPEPSRP